MQLQSMPIQVNCRTCLQEILSLEPLTSLTEKCPLGKTFKEIILYFIPNMVSTSWIDETICASCSKTLHDFAELIERCVAIEEILKEADARIDDKFRRNEDGNEEDEDAILNRDLQSSSEHLSTSPHKRSESETLQDPRKPPDQFNLCKPKINEEVFDLFDEEESLESNHLTDTSTCLVRKPTIDCQENPIEGSLLTDVEHFVLDVFDEDEETTTTTKPHVQPLFNRTEGNQGSSHDISTTQLSDIDEEIVEPVEKEESRYVTTRTNQDNSDDDRPSCSSTASGSSDTVNFISNSEVSVEQDHLHESDAVDINKQFNIIKGDSIYNYRIHPHDRVVSVSQPDEVLPSCLKDLSMRGISIYHYGKPNDMKNKRVLLLGSVMVPCPMCNAAFTRKGLRSHMKTKHDTELPISKNKTSYSCMLRPNKKEELIKSENNTLYIYDYNPRPANGKLIHPCPLCKTVTYSSMLLTRHIQRFHKDFRPYKCERCGKMFKMKKNYYSHVKKFQNFLSCNVQQCYICCKMVSRESFAHHVKGHRLYLCDKCGKSCPTASHLLVHSRTHQHGAHQQQLCPTCGKFVINMPSHMKTHETRPRTYMCHKCSKRYTSISALNGHIKNSHPDEELECKECRRKCKSMHNLKDHIKLKHSKIYKHSCDICGQQFSRSDYFRRHMKFHIDGRPPGTGTRKYTLEQSSLKCKYCQKSFRTVPQLKYHLVTHVERIRYKCRICDITCSNAQNRYRHEMRHKDPTFELTCKICWNRMNTKEDLEKHMERHEKSKKYKCQYCEEAFARRYLLSHHISQEHTNEEEVKKEKQAIFNEALKDFLI